MKTIYLFVVLSVVPGCVHQQEAVKDQMPPVYEVHSLDISNMNKYRGVEAEEGLALEYEAIHVDKPLILSPSINALVTSTLVIKRGQIQPHWMDSDTVILKITAGGELDRIKQGDIATLRFNSQGDLVSVLLKKDRRALRKNKNPHKTCDDSYPHGE